MGNSTSVQPTKKTETENSTETKETSEEKKVQAEGAPAANKKSTGVGMRDRSHLNE